jgi:hypothetical protein
MVSILISEAAGECYPYYALRFEPDSAGEIDVIEDAFFVRKAIVVCGTFAGLSPASLCTVLQCCP